MDKSEPVVIARVWAESEASVIKSLLEAYDIPVHYAAKIPTRIYPFSADGVAQIKIFVPAELENDARELLQSHSQDDAAFELVDDDASQTNQDSPDLS